tara:strand:+ start:4590 stop:5384 length:795 start_codon:yes stop_codon:yes gene_type:complete
MKIAHECPLSIFNKVQQVTDYDYALVHLFEENEEYYNTFVKAKKDGREVLLDNSIFELGTAFESDTYADWIVKLKPDWYIVPDVLDNANATIDSFDSFMLTYPDLPGKVIAVAQGNTYNELVACYKYLANDSRVDKVAMSFNHPFFQELSGGNTYYRMMVGRQWTIRNMIVDGVINKDKPHHLLGCGLPQEFIEYQGYDWIDSMDTSNPVIHGMKGIRYNEYGLDDKESVKLFTLIDEDVVACWNDIDYNIRMFREMCNGKAEQ